MRRLWKWTRRIAMGLGVAALIVLGLWVGLVPSIIERVAMAQLAEAGLPKPRLRVRGLSLTHLEMTNLAAGESGRLRIGAIGVDYGLSQLLRKRIDSIEIIGFEAEVRRRDGAWDFGPLADLKSSGEGGTSDMPFKRVALRSSALLLDLDGRRLRIPFHGSVTNAGRGILALDVTASIEGATLRLAGTVDTNTYDFDLALGGEVPELASLFAAIPARAWGALTVKAAAVREEGQVSLDATLDSDGPGLTARIGQHDLSAKTLSLTATAKLDKAFALKSLECTAKARGLLADGFPIASSTATATLQQSGAADKASVQIHGQAEADLSRWLEGEMLPKAGLSAGGTIELRSGPNSDWSVAVPKAMVTLAPADIALPSGQGKVEGLAGVLAFRADADPKHAIIKVLPDSWVGIKSAEASVGGETVSVGAVRLRLAGHKKQPLLAVGLEGGQLLSAIGALVVEAAGPVAVSAGEGATLTLGTTRSVVEGSWGEKGGSLAASLGASGLAASVQRKFGDTLVTASVPEAVLLLKARREWKKGTRNLFPLSLEFLVGTPQGSKGASAAVAGAEVAAGSIEARGTVTLAGAMPPVVDARLSLADATVRHKEAGLALAGVSAELPLAWNVAKPPESGTFAVKSIELKGKALPALSGTLAVAARQAAFTVAWEPLPGAKLRVEGSAAAGPLGATARAYVSLPLFRLEDEEALGRLVPQLKGVLMSGSFALDGYLHVSPAGVRPNLALTVLDGTFKSKAWEADAAGVYATVRIDSFEPVLTPRKELQVALVRRAKMGKLEVSDGFVAFRLEPKEAEGRPTGWTAYLQRAEWGWAGGRLYVEDLRLDPAAKEHTVTVYARDLKLGGLLALIPDEEATGVGSLDGTLPVTIGTWPDIRFGNGKLRTPPGQAGWFKVKNSEVLGNVLEGTDKRFQTDDLYVEIKKRLINAFKNFEYDELNVDFIRDGESFVARVNTKGRARTGVRQEFGGVTLNFPDFDKVLRDAILVSRRIFGE